MVCEVHGNVFSVFFYVVCVHGHVPQCAEVRGPQ